MALKVNTAIRQAGIFVVSPIGSIDTAGHTIFQEKVNSERPAVAQGVCKYRGTR
jgi:hypothetical protein